MRPQNDRLTIYFPEPSVADDSWSLEGEKPVEWLLRSTLPRAVSLRASLNENLSHFAPKHAKSLARKLRVDWKSHYFELLVGRCLQEMGAELEHEPLGTSGKRVDYRAVFPEAAVCVEAFSKRMNLHAVPGQAFIDNSEQRIRLAYRDSRKRRQAEGVSEPAFLAVDGGVLGADLDDFDAALLGTSVQHLGFESETVGLTFRAWMGEMLKDAPSPWAGVLAFIEPGVFSANDPILYVSPYFRAQLPWAFLKLRKRVLATVDFAGSSAVMNRIRFAEPYPEGS